jgi:putative ATPase
MRPRTLDEFVGQESVIGEGKPLRRMIERDELSSIVLWGPPGSGKTTLASIVAGHTQRYFSQISAVNSGVADLRKAVAEAQDRQRVSGRRTILFVDELHRFNRAQQDALLPYVEAGTIVFIGATTENPSFYVVAPLLSRSRVFRLELLPPEDIEQIVRRALTDRERGLGEQPIAVADETLHALALLAAGDARTALNLLEVAAGVAEPGADGARAITRELIEEAAQHRTLLYDREGDAHYDTISAFIKSLRASDPDAAIYYLAVMIAGGEDPKFIARRLIVAASEDVGNADPRALEVAVAAARAVEFVGLPEARINLAQATTYIALAPKSNASYLAIDDALARVEREGARRPPLALRDASRANARNLGHGTGYRYPHDSPDGVLDESLLPEGIEDAAFFRPTDRGPEGELSARLRELRGGGSPDGEGDDRPF